MENWNDIEEKEWKINGVLHRVDGPAFVSSKVKEWRRYGKLHREDGPAVMFCDGDYEWYLDGLRHREDGPAVKRRLSWRWFQNGDLHRENGPASIDIYPGKETIESWYYEDRLHRVGGPARTVVNVKTNEETHFWFYLGRKHRAKCPAVIIEGGKRLEWWLNGELEYTAKKVRGVGMRVFQLKTRPSTF